MSLSESIKLLRTKAFLSQEAFAAEIKVSIATINRWEHGRAKPNITAMKNIKEFCRTNKISFDEIDKEWVDFIVEKKRSKEKNE